MQAMQFMSLSNALEVSDSPENYTNQQVVVALIVLSKVIQKAAKITQEQEKKFEVALSQAEARAYTDPLIAQLERDALRSQFEELRDQLESKKSKCDTWLKVAYFPANHTHDEVVLALKGIANEVNQEVKIRKG